MRGKTLRQGNANGSILVDTEIFLEDMCQLVKEGRKVVIPVSGSSMTPFLISGRDCISLRKPLPKDLKKGKIALFRRTSGQFVLHRICSVKNGEYYFAGDAQYETEGPIRSDQIEAVEDKVMRKGKWITGFSPEALFFRYIWIRIIFARKYAVKAYRGIKKL